MPKPISHAEFTVMEVLWEESPLAASDVYEKLETSKDWNIRTVKTLLSRLTAKKALATRKDGRRFLYVPQVSREVYVTKAAKSLTDRLFGGRAAPLVAQLAESGELSDQDIADLEKLIQDLKK